MPWPLTLALLATLLVACGPPEREGPPDIIVVCMDTLRADRLGVYGNADGVSPNLDRFAEDAVVFDQAWAVANETLYSHAALLTSRYSTETGPIFETFRLGDDPPTLASVLGIYGYQSAAFTGGAGGSTAGSPAPTGAASTTACPRPCAGGMSGGTPSGPRCSSCTATTPTTAT
jgi:hypothetical protein